MISTSLSFLRYVVVGVISNVSGYLIYLGVTWGGVEPKIAMTCLYIFGASLGFIGNRQWAFSHRGCLKTSAIKYSIVHLIGYGLNFSMLWFFADQLGYPHQWVQAAAVFVVASFLFVVFRTIVFPLSRIPD